MSKTKINNTKALFWKSTIKQKQLRTESDMNFNRTQLAATNPQNTISEKVKRKKEEQQRKRSSKHLHIISIPRLTRFRVCSAEVKFSGDMNNALDEYIFSLRSRAQSPFLQVTVPPTVKLTFSSPILRILLVSPENPPLLTPGLFSAFVRLLGRSIRSGKSEFIIHRKSARLAKGEIFRGLIKI